MRSHLIVIACLYCTLATNLWGQGKKKPAAEPGAGNQVGFEIVTVNGTLEGMQGPILRIVSDGNVETFATVGMRSTIKFTGQAKLGWLTTGQLVRFSARFDSNGKAESPLKTLEVFSPEQNPRMSPEEMRNQMPGLYPDGGSIGNATKGLFGDKKSEKKSDQKAEKKSEKKTDPRYDKGNANSKIADSADADSIQGYKVVGQVVGIQANMMVVNAGGQRVTIGLDPNVSINVNVSNLSYVSQGDIVKLNGLRNPRDPKSVQVESIEIKAVKQIGLDGSQASKGGRTRKSKLDDDKSKKGTDKSDLKAKLDKNAKT